MIIEVIYLLFLLCILMMLLLKSIIGYSIAGIFLFMLWIDKNMVLFCNSFKDENT